MRIGPLPPAARALGPDLARGFMLLFIALANTHYFVRGTSYLGGYPADGTAPDRAVTWLLSTFVDGRSFPLFGLLFGYGVARVVERQQERGRKGVRRLLRRRALVLIAVGLVDAMLFYIGDILGAYGMLLLIGSLMVYWRARWLVLTAVLFLIVNVLPSPDWSTISRSGPDASMLPPDLIAMLVERAPVALFVAGLGPIGFLPLFAAGLLAGRVRLLERPDQFRRLLPAVAVTGAGIAVAGAQPIALMLAGVITPPAQPVQELAGALHSGTGMLGGIGYAALFALSARRWAADQQTPGRRPGALVTAIAATGQRSMSCYLMQSVTWAVVFTPFLLNLSGTLTVTTTALLATATWSLTVLIADRMRRSGIRGPFENLTRHLTYRGTAPGRRRWAGPGACAAANPG
ncbi:MAG TPA: DUF418 domain-containing protein [Actinoplanes sp.]|nr:DUF418 domain-containing protein [Actinoplanes sp.]